MDFMSTENPLTLAGIETATFRFVVQHINHCATALYSGYPVFPGCKERPGRGADPSPLIVPWSRKSIDMPLIPLWTVRPVQILSACTVELYLYSPYGPYGLYSRAIPLLPCGPYGLYSRAIPQLPLWAVRPVQSLSACTVELYRYSPYGPYGLYRASVPVQ